MGMGMGMGMGRCGLEGREEWDCAREMCLLYCARFFISSLLREHSVPCFLVPKIL